MSINVTETAHAQPSLEQKTATRLSLCELKEKIRALREVPALETLGEWLREIQVTEDDLRPYRAFKPKTYTRHRVCRSDYAELLVLCWKPGQRTPIHDHNGSHGAVRICEGVMWETMFALDEEEKLFYQSSSEWRSGGVTGAAVPDIHQLGNPEVSGQNLVTLHLYAPPLGVLNTYKVGSSEVGHYTPDEFMDGAGI